MLEDSALGVLLHGIQDLENQINIFINSYLKHKDLYWQGSVFRSENDIYPPPLLKIIFFRPLATCHFSTPIVAFLP